MFSKVCFFLSLVISLYQIQVITANGDDTECLNKLINCTTADDKIGCIGPDGDCIQVYCENLELECKFFGDTTGACTSYNQSCRGDSLCFNKLVACSSVAANDKIACIGADGDCIQVYCGNLELECKFFGDATGACTAFNESCRGDILCFNKLVACSAVDNVRDCIGEDKDCIKIYCENLELECQAFGDETGACSRFKENCILSCLKRFNLCIANGGGFSCIKEFLTCIF